MKANPKQIHPVQYKCQAENFKKRKQTLTPHTAVKYLHISQYSVVLGLLLGTNNLQLQADLLYMISLEGKAKL